MSKKTADTPTASAMKAYAGVAVALIILILVLPANSQVMRDYTLSPLEYRILYFAISIPSLIVWLLAFYGYAKLEEYVISIRKTDEASAFDRLASGSKWLAWSLPAPALTAITLDSIADKAPSFRPAAIIITNYVALAFSLIALSIIGIASRELISRGKVRLTASSAPGIMLLFVIGGVLYCYLTFRHFEPGSLSSTTNPYYLPIWLMLLTITIPYLYAWFVGLLAAYEITTYSKQARGVLYKQALHLLVGGLIIVIAGSISLQYISSVTPATGHLTLNYRLLLMILLRIVNGIGFGLIALGALRLRKIEEV